MLNENQLLARNHISGPMLIIAGAGSGKTSTLTARIEHMINDLKIDPNSILAVTFTNKASQEMKHRFGNILKKEYSKSIFQNRGLPMVGTFHSIGVMILKEKINNIPGYNKDFLIYDEQDKLSIIKSIIKEDLKLDDKKYIPRAIASYISNAKNTNIGPENYKKTISSHIQEIVSKVYDLYFERLKKNNSLDFDDILLFALELLKNPEILNYYQEKYKYIMIDEYQDTNTVQYNIIKLLASKYRNLAVVGDDWQSIYSFRGADMSNILNFKKDYPDALVIKLEQNYRSTQTIVNARNKLIKNNKTAIDKTLFSQKEIGDKITIIDAIDDRLEASLIAKIISQEGAPYKKNLILYRTNGQSRQIEEYLISNSIPYKIIGGLKFYDRKEIKDLVSYLKTIFNPNDEISLKRIINTPSRKIGDKSIEIIDNAKKDFGLNYLDILQNIDEVDDLGPQAKKSIFYFYELLKDFIGQTNTKNVFELLYYIIEKIGYIEYLKTEYSKEEIDSKIDNIEELKNLASNYSGLEPKESLSIFLEEISLLTDQDKNDENDFVSLMTVHTSKGLEFENVFICGLEESIFPHSRSISEIKELEEERRLMYVAMTRAKNKLFLSKASSRYAFGNYSSNLPSRFFDEIPKEFTQDYITPKSSFSFGNDFNIQSSGNSVINKIKNTSKNDISIFNIGDKINHHKFGDGIIRTLNGNIAEIYFSIGGTKKMNIELAPITKI